MHQLFQPSLQTVAFWVIVCAWVIISSRSGRGREVKDRNPTAVKSDVLLFLGTDVAMVVVVLLKLVTPNVVLYSNTSLLWLGLCMIVCGTVIRQIAIRTLGKYHVLTIATQGKQPVITTGIYRFVRHPSYLGAMVAVAGFALSLNSLIGSIVLVILNVSGLIYRIRLEDVYLNEQLGAPYKTYTHHTARLIPYVW